MTGGVGLARFNPGNIEYGPGVAKMKGLVLPHDGNRFCRFESMVMGIRAIAIILMAYYDRHNINTVGDAIARWAPAADRNPTAIYANNVATWMGVAASDVLDFHDATVMYGLVKGIIHQENGSDVCTNDQIRSGISAAGFREAVKPLSQSKTISTSNIGLGGTAVVGTATLVQQTADSITPLLPAIQSVHTVFDAIRPVLPFVIGAGLLVAFMAFIYVKFLRAKMSHDGIV